MVKSPTRLTDSQRALIESNVGLARSAAWKYFRSLARVGLDWDDVFSIACMGLMRAARTFNPERAKASTYLTYGCECELLMELRRQNAKARSAFTVISLDEARCQDRNGNNLFLKDSIVSREPSPEAVILERCSENQVWHMLEGKNNAKHKQVLDLRIRGLAQSEIACRLGYSQSYVSRILSKIKTRVEQELAS